MMLIADYRDVFFYPNLKLIIYFLYDHTCGAEDRLYFFSDVGKVLCPPGTDLRLYSGNVSTTNGGRTCQPWAETSPFYHTLMGSHNYPIDGSVEAANNYCRNIHSSHIPWCFTMDIERPFQYCDERICDGTYE